MIVMLIIDMLEKEIMQESVAQLQRLQSQKQHEGDTYLIRKKRPLGNHVSLNISSSISNSVYIYV